MTVKAKLIFEILGRPANHIKDALGSLVEKVGSDKGVKIIDKINKDPKKVEKSDNLWVTFSDVDLEFENIYYLFNTIITYMPSHVELYEPEKLKIDASGINELGNFIVTRLHRYDAIAKRLMSEREIMIKQLEHLKNGGKIEDIFPKNSGKTEKKTNKKTTKKKSKK